MATVKAIRGSRLDLTVHLDVDGEVLELKANVLALSVGDKAELVDLLTKDR